MEANGRATARCASCDELALRCELKDRFIAVAGHEMRNLLAPIVLSLEALAQSSDDNTNTELLSIASRHAQQLTRLVDDLIEASRLASGKVQLRQESIDARHIVERSIQAVAPAIQAHGQELLVSRCDVPLWLHADPLRLEQVFLNLLNNAVKYTPQGGCIWLLLSRQNGTAVFQIRDSGRGIQPELIPRVFDYFSQGDSDGHISSGGLGIGLAMVKTLVEMHNGFVEGHSDGHGCGADFTVRLPIMWP